MVVFDIDGVMPPILKRLLPACIKMVPFVELRSINVTGSPSGKVNNISASAGAG
ncbi:hypothetical protein D3C79_1099670 [compost metagenome]